MIITAKRLQGVAVVLAGLLIGAGSVAAYASSLNRGQDLQTSFPRNASGMTYGSGLDAVSPATEPDLIEAIGVDGTHGYVRATDVKPSAPTTPANALAKQTSAGARTVPLYAVDGKTVIGSFVLDAPTAIGTITKTGTAPK